MRFGDEQNKLHENIQIRSRSICVLIQTPIDCWMNFTKTFFNFCTHEKNRHRQLLVYYLFIIYYSFIYIFTAFLFF